MWHSFLDTLCASNNAYTIWGVCIVVWGRRKKPLFTVQSVGFLAFLSAPFLCPLLSRRRFTRVSVSGFFSPVEANFMATRASCFSECVRTTSPSPCIAGTTTAAVTISSTVQQHTVYGKSKKKRKSAHPGGRFNLAEATTSSSSFVVVVVIDERREIHHANLLAMWLRRRRRKCAKALMCVRTHCKRAPERPRAAQNRRGREFREKETFVRGN